MEIIAQTYNLEKLINKFGGKGLNSALAEVNKIHDRTCFRPIYVDKLTSQERKISMELIIIIMEKRYERI